MWNLVALNNLEFSTKRSLFGFKQISATGPVPTRPERWTQLNELRRRKMKTSQEEKKKPNPMREENPRNIFCYDNVGTFFKSKNHFQLIRIEIRLECAQCNRKTSSDDIVAEKRLRNSPRGLKMEIFWHQQHDKFLHERIKRGLEIDAMRWMTLSFSAAHGGRKKREEKSEVKWDLQRFLVDVEQHASVGRGSSKKRLLCSVRNLTWCFIDNINFELSLFVLSFMPVSLLSHQPTHSFLLPLKFTDYSTCLPVC